MSHALERFHPATVSWFRGAFGTPTPAQEGAWGALAGGANTLVVAPTGSGKTLSAFLAALDRLLLAPGASADPGAAPAQGTRVLYISPLKALAVDVERNLRAPLAGITREAAALGVEAAEVTVGIRTGDTPPEERRRQRTRPPHVLVTTPESLFLLLTSAARETLSGVDTVIIDEIHAVAGTKRGAHLALSLERLDELLQAPAQRVGLSATVRPHSEVARFLAGERPVTIVAPGSDKRFDLTVRVPVEDMTDLTSAAAGGVDAGVTAPPGTPGQGSIWPHVERQVVDLVTAHRSTIVFVNSRRLAERLTARLNEIHAEDVAPGSLPEPPPRPPAQIMVPSEVTRGAPTDLAMAHHGSVSKERRAMIEDALKSGRLRAVVATSSLELGIDMGTVDLVVQVESPPSVASGLQRVGRAGHQVGEVSRAAVFPKHRADLVHSAVTVERMLAGQIEALSVIANPLDVLAQQTVAACAFEALDVEEWFAAVRRTAPFAGLPRAAFEATLDMLAGKYPSADFAELRPRLVWDRDAGTLTGRPGAQRLAVTSGGTIPDRGLFGVFMVGEKATRVGELDEEMVYETRVGDVFALGASSWRVEEITHDRVLVSPAPGGTGRLPFWLGDDQGRPAELGRALGGFLREVSGGGEAEVAARLDAAGLDANAVVNLRRYLAEQREATGYVPSDTTLVVERFRDEVGDWRVVLHSPFGARVHWPWAEAVRARLAAAHGFDAVPVVSDDGIILRVPDMGGNNDDDDGVGVRPGAETFAIDAEEAVDLVTRHVGGSALFASRFRECSARALLFPRLDPGRRAPLWQQRQKSAQLLDVARRYPDFPMILEAVRECLQDVYDVPALERLLGEIASRTVRIVEVDTPSASPFAQSLLFDYVGAFVYEGDSPLAEKRAAALSIDPTLLGQLLGRVELRELLDEEVLDAVEQRLQHLEPDRAARDAEAVADLLRLLGPLTVEEAAARSADPVAVSGWLDSLVAAGRAVVFEHARRTWWAGVEDVARLRDGLGVPPSPGVPSAFLGDVEDPLGELIRRYARTHGPFTVEAVAARFGLGVAVARGVLDRLTASGALLAGEFRPGASGPEWCDAEVLRHIRRRSLAALRSQIEPVSHSALGRFLPAWQGIGTAGSTGTGTDSVPATGATTGTGAESGVDGVLAVIEQLDGVAVPASALEPLILASRVRDYSPAMLDELLAGGEVVWCGRGRAGSRDGRISLHPTDSAGASLPLDRPQPEGPVQLAVVEALRGGALFFRDIVSRVKDGADPPTATRPTETLPEGAGPVTEGAIRDALWDLVWDGVVTNDTLAPLRAVLAGGGPSGAGTAHRASRTSARPRRARLGRTSLAQLSGAMSAGLRTPPALAGRWSLVPEPVTDATLRAHTCAETLLARHGVVTRGAVEAEEIPGGFAAVYKVLAQMEDSGRCRRGYFVEGLGAAQFAAGNTIDRLRTLDDTADDTPWPSGTDTPSVRVLAATDPANPYGAALPWPAGGVGGSAAHSAAGSAAHGAAHSAAEPAAATGSRAGHRPGRKAGALVVLVDGLCVLFVERGGRTVLVFDDRGDAVPLAATVLADSVRSGAVGQLIITTLDGDTVHASPYSAAFQAAGFSMTPKGLRIRK